MTTTDPPASPKRNDAERGQTEPKLMLEVFPDLRRNKG